MLGALLKNLVNGIPETWILFLTFLSITVYHILKWVKSGKLKKLTTPLGSLEFGNNSKSGGVTAKDIITTLHFQLGAIREISTIELKNLPRDLMNTAEAALDKVISKMHTDFLTLLESKLPENDSPITHQSFNLYRLALSQGRSDVLHEIRRMIHDNNFIGRQESGIWLKYKQIKTTNMIDIMKDRLDISYICDSPSRSEVAENNKKKILSPDENPNDDFNLYVIISSLLEEFLKISISHHKKIDELESQIDCSIEKLFNIPDTN